MSAAAFAWAFLFIVAFAGVFVIVDECTSDFDPEDWQP